jgi:hypothetical protein
MYMGEPRQGKEFYDLLVNSVEFTSELGRMTLASGMLEAEIVKYYIRRGHELDPKTSTFGRLIGIGRKHGLFESNELTALDMLNEQRNEFTHRVYSLFTGLMEQERLPTADLLDSDVHTYTGYAGHLRENLERMTELVIRK